MSTNYYSVFQVNMKFPPTTLVSFTDKEKALKHAELLSENGNTYQVVPSEVNLFLPVAEII